MARPGGATSAPDRASPAVEDYNLHTGDSGGFGKHLLGIMGLPGGGQVASVFVAIRIADHHLLAIASRLKGRPVGRAGIEGPHDGATSFKLMYLLEEGHDVQLYFGAGPLACPLV